MKLEKLEHNRVKASFSVSKDEFAKALDAAFEVCNGKVTIKGFRKGKAPKAKYLATYGVESLYNDAIDFVVREKMQNELFKDESLQIVSQPELDVDFAKVGEEGFDFTLSFDVLPEVKLGEYKGIKVKKLSDKPSKEEIENEKDRILRSKTVLEAKEDGVIELGNTAVFDFLGTKDGVPFDGGKAENYELKIGSGQFIPGFEDQMVGMKKGEEKDINVVFPENYGEKSLAGQPCVFHITLHEVKKEVKPELTEELFKELKLENVKTAEDFEKHIKDTIKARKVQTNKNLTTSEVIEKVVKNATLDVPASMIKDRIATYKQQLENQAKQYKIPVETLLQFQGLTMEKYEEAVKANAENEVTTELVLSEVAKAEKIAPTKEEVNDFMKEYALSHGIDEKEIAKFDSLPFFENLVFRKTVDFLYENRVEE